MRNLIHFYYQNKKKILTIILIIAIVIVVIQILNHIAQNNITSNTETNNNNSNNNTVQGNTVMQSNNSLVSGEQIPTTSLQKVQKTINDFITVCNSGNVQEAYDMLTTQCKEELYPTIEIFNNNYLQKLFKEEKMCLIENWSGNTYKVTIQEDMLKTGKASNEKYIDYITIVEEENKNKLNINNYIGRTEINNTTEKDNVEITVISKDTYMDYEIYNLQIYNKSDNNILLDDLQQTDTIYIQDSNNIKYVAQNYKLLKSDMIINKGLKRNMEITFSNGYTVNRKYKNLIFSNVNLDYENNNSEANKTNIFSIKIK